jgi:hypothetical protein
VTNKKAERQDEADDKGADQRGLGERIGRQATGPAIHPATKESGTKGASNAGEDASSGSE